MDIIGHMVLRMSSLRVPNPLKWQTLRNPMYNGPNFDTNIPRPRQLTQDFRDGVHGVAGPKCNHYATTFRATSKNGKQYKFYPCNSELLVAELQAQTIS